VPMKLGLPEPRVPQPRDPALPEPRARALPGLPPALFPLALPRPELFRPALPPPLALPERLLPPVPSQPEPRPLSRCPPRSAPEPASPTRPRPGPFPPPLERLRSRFRQPLWPSLSAAPVRSCLLCWRRPYDKREIPHLRRP